MIRVPGDVVCGSGEGVCGLRAMVPARLGKNSPNSRSRIAYPVTVFFKLWAMHTSPHSVFTLGMPRS